MRQIIFKSTPENFKKEFLNLKRCTVRKQDNENDIRFEVLDAIAAGKLHVVRLGIENTETQETFYNKITDVTVFEGFYIISW